MLKVKTNAEQKVVAAKKNCNIVLIPIQLTLTCGVENQLQGFLKAPKFHLRFFCFHLSLPDYFPAS